MKFVCLQSGHEGRTTGSTGAPGEIELNVRIRNRLSEILISKGFSIQLVDADPISAEINKDFDLFLALHGDANVYGTGGGLVDYPDPSIDMVNAESKRIADAIASEYFKHSEIVNHPERSNANTKYYYMWRLLSAKTPCVIVEMGVVQDAHDKVLLADTERIATALARGVCKAFGVVYDVPIPPSEPPASPPPPPDCSEVVKQAVSSAIAENDKKWQTKLTSAKDLIEELKLGLAVNMEWKSLFSIAWKKFWAAKKAGD